MSVLIILIKLNTFFNIVLRKCPLFFSLHHNNGWRRSCCWRLKLLKFLLWLLLPLKLRWRLALNLHANSSQAKSSEGREEGAKQFVICLLRLAFSAISIFAGDRWQMERWVGGLVGWWKMGADLGPRDRANPVTKWTTFCQPCNWELPRCVCGCLDILSAAAVETRARIQIDLECSTHGKWQMANVWDPNPRKFLLLLGQTFEKRRFANFAWAREFTSCAKAPDSLESAEKGQKIGN